MADRSVESYDTRLKRYTDAISLREPDRVPIIPWNFHFYPAKWVGMSFQDAMHNHQGYYDALKQAVLQHEFDMAPESSVFPAQPWEALGLKYWKWPGHGVPKDRVFQYDEHEIMAAEEYDDFIGCPDTFTMNALWPRISTTFEPLADLPPLHHCFSVPEVLGAYLCQPPFVNMLEELLRLGREWAKHNEVKTRCYAELEEAGFVRTYGGVIFPPFDMVSVWLRGLRGSMLDMYRHPDRLLAAIDVCTEMQFQSGVRQAAVSQNPRLSLFAYRGAAGFMSTEQFERFYWPSLLKLLNTLVDEGLTPVAYVEGDYTPRLHYLTDLPKGKVPIHFDMIDRVQTAKVISDHNCFWGNVPVSLMELGTPQEVADDVKELIDLFAAGGGLIIDGAGTITDDTKPENVEAMVDTVHTYGRR